MFSKLSMQFFALAILIFNSSVMSQQQPAMSIQKSDFKIGEILTFESKILNESRTLNIYLPEVYQSESDRQYPVIYLLDGSSNEDFIHVSGLVQFCSFPWIKILPQSIVVGIANVDRKRDFTFPSGNAKDKQDFPTSGGAQRFIDFLEQEVQTLISKNYRTKQDRTLIGQSLGGLLATEVLHRAPKLFDRYIIVSPSLWWDDESLLKSASLSVESVRSIYVAVGKEDETMIRVARELLAKSTKNKSDKTKTYFRYFEQQSHGDVLHLAIYDAFEKIFRNSK